MTGYTHTHTHSVRTSNNMHTHRFAVAVLGCNLVLAGPVPYGECAAFTRPKFAASSAHARTHARIQHNTIAVQRFRRKKQKRRPACVRHARSAILRRASAIWRAIWRACASICRRLTNCNAGRAVKTPLCGRLSVG